MNKVIVIILLLFPLNALAFKPAPCEMPLNNLITNLFSAKRLGKGIADKPGKPYMHKGHPNLCTTKPSIKSKKYNWSVHMHENELPVIIERKSLENFNSVYFGPFNSAYRK